ncbi:MAG: hypothetical protein IJZ42_11760 [Lachnospiraceae bacterium]|nr:hypothetical protein [Lachnospiraceae bacterium]
MRTKKLFGMKKVMRTMALGLAAMLVVGSLNVMEVEAINDTANGIIYPGAEQVGGNWTYTYDSNDIFYAATHVHLFGEYVKTDVHTHGNVMALDADLSEIGMRDGKIAYPGSYKEVNYVGNSVIGAGSTINGHMILGSGITYNAPDVSISGGGTAPLGNLVRGNVYQETSGFKAVDITSTLSQLETKSTEWAQNTINTAGTSVSFSDINTRVINTNQTAAPDDHVFINLSYAQWRGADGQTTQPVTIAGLDSDVSHKGIVVINLDLAGSYDPATPIDEVTVDLTLNEIKAVDAGGKYYSNTEHTTAAFGSCRIVYNIIDSNDLNSIYRGKVTFGNTVYGTILAPGADVTVNAINGNVMARRITHNGGESHRLDVYPIFTKNDGSGNVAIDKIGTEDIVLNLKLKDGSTFEHKTDYNDATTGIIESNVSYTLYKDDGTGNGLGSVAHTDSAFNNVNAVWKENLVWDKDTLSYKDVGCYEVLIGSDEVTAKLTPGTYWLKKDDAGTDGVFDNGYATNDVVYKVVIATDGSVTYAEKVGNANAGTPKRDVLTDILVKQTVVTNEKIEINVEFSGPTGTTAPNPSGVTYEIYEDSATQTKVPNSAATVADGKVVFGTGITGSLDKNTDYYIKVTGNDSGYKDDSADVYKVQFGDDGKPKYYNSTTGNYESTPPTDKLIKNEGIELNVTLEGDTSTGTDSNVKYNVYDSNGNPVLDSSVSATKGSSDTTYKVVVDTAVTTDKLNRQPAEYYIAIDTNGSGYDDKVPNEKFWVIFDNNGNAQYSTDKQTWSDTPLEDVLVKAKDTSSEPTSQPANPPAGDSGSTGGTTNDGGNGSNSGSAGSSTPETNNGGASNNASNNTAGDNTNKGTTDGASDANATDSALTGSNAMDSAKTGELKTIYIFAGFASVIAIAAGVYVFIKRKRA